MNLVGYDRKNKRLGLHVEVAVTACGILTGCYDGYFTKDRINALDLDPQSLLSEGSYYYHVPNDDHYAIYPSFEHWRFPHNSGHYLFDRRTSQSAFAPAPVSKATSAVMDRDKRCLITGQREYRERAHLCPRAELTWFRQNKMRRYNNNDLVPANSLADDTANSISLREDIHTAFDQRCFAIVAKEGVWTAHFLARTVDLGPRYHNMQVDVDNGVSGQFLLARLAWAIFPLVQPFVQAAFKRWLWIRVEDEDGSVDWEKTWMKTEDINAQIFPPRSRSPSKGASPPKGRSPTRQHRTKAIDPQDNPDAIDDTTWFGTKRFVRTNNNSSSEQTLNSE